MWSDILYCLAFIGVAALMLLSYTKTLFAVCFYRSLYSLRDF